MLFTFWHSSSQREHLKLKVTIMKNYRFSIGSPLPSLSLETIVCHFRDAAHKGYCVSIRNWIFLPLNYSIFLFRLFRTFSPKSIINSNQFTKLCFTKFNCVFIKSCSTCFCNIPQWISIIETSMNDMMFIVIAFVLDGFCLHTEHQLKYIENLEFQYEPHIKQTFANIIIRLRAI